VTLFSISLANNHPAESKPTILPPQKSGLTLPLSPRERARVRGKETPDNPPSKSPQHAIIPTALFLKGLELRGQQGKGYAPA